MMFFAAARILYASFEELAAIVRCALRNSGQMLLSVSLEVLGPADIRNTAQSCLEQGWESGGWLSTLSTESQLFGVPRLHSGRFPFDS